MLVVVAPLVGAWIEISESIDLTRSRYWSLPSWERGLKFPIKWDIFVDIPVAPLVGAWIEIIAKLYKYVPIFVAPLVGAWIEILKENLNNQLCMVSLPSWERGLKLQSRGLHNEKMPSLPSWERGLKF